MTSKNEFILLYDGNCPICQKEVAWLRRRNSDGRLGFQDIHADNFEPGHLNKTIEQLMAEIHGIYPDGTVIKGMPVIRATYSAAGLGWLMTPTGWPVLQPIFDALYAWFARHRLSFGQFFVPASCGENSCRTRTDFE